MKTRVKRRPFGRTGLSVSEVSFGAMNLRMLDTTEQALEILHYVLDQGINLIDTARAYNGENSSGQLVESEVLVGQAIRSRQDLDEPIVVVTKGHGYTLPDLDEELEISRAKLGIEDGSSLRIGDNAIQLVYFFHGINQDRWQTISTSGVLERIQDIKASGRISHIGFSSHYGDADAIKRAIDTGIFEVVELPYNVFNRSLGEDGEEDILQYAHQRGVAVINMKAFNGNGMVPIFHMLKPYLSIDYAAMLKFCLANPYISTVDAGARWVPEFAKDIEVSLEQGLTDQEIQALKAEADGISPDLADMCRECMHCLEKFACPQGLNFPRMLALYSRYRIAVKRNQDVRALNDAYQALPLQADDCVECGECIPWCEYKLDIPQMLKRAHATLA